jgi:hypothetical protein
MDHPQPPAHAPAHGATQVKAKVYKQRIRLKDFFIDFDKLRSGYITQNQVRCTFPVASAPMLVPTHACIPPSNTLCVLSHMVLVRESASSPPSRMCLSWAVSRAA